MFVFFTLPKFNSSPLKNDCKGRRSFPFGGLATLQGHEKYGLEKVGRGEARWHLFFFLKVGNFNFQTCSQGKKRETKTAPVLQHI